MRQKSSANQGRDQQEPEEGRKQRRIMTKLEQESPQPSPLDLLGQSQGQEPEGEEAVDELEDIESELSSLDSDEEIVICPQTNKFDRKRPSKGLPTRRPEIIRSHSHRTECDQQGDGATTQLDYDDNDDESIPSFQIHPQRSELQLLSQLATVTTTTLSPSPTPRPFRSTSPPLTNQSHEEAIDSTTTTTTTHPYSPYQDSPLNHREEQCGVLSTSHRNRRISSNPIKADKNDFDYLDALLDSINEGNFATFSKLVDAGPKSDRNLLNVFIRGRTLLHHALTRGRGLEWCKTLVEKGADPNLSDTYGWHPLHLAANVSGTVTSFIADCCEAA